MKTFEFGFRRKKSTNKDQSIKYHFFQATSTIFLELLLCFHFTFQNDFLLSLYLCLFHHKTSNKNIQKKFFRFFILAVPCVLQSLLVCFCWVYPFSFIQFHSSLNIIAEDKKTAHTTNFSEFLYAVHHWILPPPPPPWPLNIVKTGFFRSMEKKPRNDNDCIRFFSQLFIDENMIFVLDAKKQNKKQKQKQDSNRIFLI